MLDFVLTLMAGILIAAVSSWITVQLSLRRFRTERWWELKVQAYERVIGALHDSKVFLNEHIGAALFYADISDDKANELNTLPRKRSDRSPA